MNTEFKNRKLSLLTDLYELLMMQGFYKNEKMRDKISVFDVFYRKNPYGNGFALYCGLSEIIDYVINLKFEDEDIVYLRNTKMFDEDFLNYIKSFKFTGSLYSFLEGSIVNIKEPIIKVVAPLPEAMLLEGAILSIFNHETLIATKAYRICKAANGKAVMEFGLRRAHNIDASLYGAKAAVIAGCVGTSNVLSAKMYDMICMGTMAHSWVMSYDSEYEAFYQFAKRYNDMAILLVDTYDVLKSGVPNAIKVFQKLKEEGWTSKKYGIRIDSGDLCYLSIESRIMLDEAGFKDALICVSNDLDENLIMSLNNQGAKIDLYGVGTKLITGHPESSLGGVYKMSAIKDKNENSFIPKIKISENSDKITNPGNKEVYRIYDENDKIVADLIALSNENINIDEDIMLFDPIEIWKKTVLQKNKFKVEKMLKEIIVDGKLVYIDVSVKEKANYFKEQMTHFNSDHLRITNPKEYHVDLSHKLYDIKMQMLHSG